MPTTKFYTEHELRSMFDDYLNSTTNTVVLWGMHYEPAYVLREVDPIAYRCMFADWMSEEGLDYED